MISRVVEKIKIYLGEIFIYWGRFTMGFIALLKGEQPGIIASMLNYKDPGHYGEYLTDYALNHDNVPGRSQTFDNLYIPHRGQTTEVDVLMLHEKGIWVFESKHYSGWIFGKADQRQWTQSLNSRTKEHFYNPILQNRTHINALADYLGLPRENFHSYVVFSEKCELKSVPDSCDEYVILRRNHLLRELRKDLAARDVIFDEARMASIAERLEAAHKTDELAEQHIADVKAFEEGDACPLCGGRLVERNGRYGKFIGCSNYPRCRFTRQME